MPSIDAGRPIPQTTDVEVASGGNAVNDHLHAASLQFIVMTSATSVQRLPATSTATKATGHVQGTTRYSK